MGDTIDSGEVFFFLSCRVETCGRLDSRSLMQVRRGCNRVNGKRCFSQGKSLGACVEE